MPNSVDVSAQHSPAFARRRVPRRQPCTVHDGDLDVRLAFAPGESPRVVGDSETVIATMRGRAVGLGSVTADLQPAFAYDDTDAIARLFDVEARVTITDRRCVVIGGYGWSDVGAVDVAEGSFLIATFAHEVIASVEARRVGVGWRRVSVDLVGLNPVAALRLTIVGGDVRRVLETVVSPVVDDRLFAPATPEERDRLLQVRAGGFAEDRGRIVAWMVPPGVDHGPELEMPSTVRSVAGCPHCGSARRAGARFCGGCGFEATDTWW